MDFLFSILVFLSFFLFTFILYQLGKDFNRVFTSWFARLKARRHFLIRGVHRSLPSVFAIYFSSLLTLILFSYTLRHQLIKDHRAFITDGFVFIWLVLCHIRTGIVFSERGNLLRVCTVKEQVINALIWLILFAGILYLLQDLIVYPDTYYIIITLVAIMVTLTVMRFRNVKKEKYPDRAGLLKSKRVTFFRTSREDELF